MRPFFSIVIPTRNRAKMLEYSVQTALLQDFDDFEVVICDDASEDNTPEVARSYSNAKTRYVRAPRPLGISKNFEFGLSQSRGIYTLIQGDDDGLLPTTLSSLHEVIQETGAKVIRWHKALYNWPKCPWGKSNFLIYAPPRFPGGFVSSATLLRNAAALLDSNELPCLVNSAVHTDVLETLRAKTGKLILSYAADTSAGFTFLCLVDEIYVLNKVISITGISEFSHGALLIRKEDTKIEQEFRQLGQKTGEFPYTYWNTLGSSISAITLDSMHDVAKYFPEKIPLEKVDFARAYAQSIVEYSWITDTQYRKQLAKRIYRIALESQGRRDFLRTLMLVARAKCVNLINSPAMQNVSSVLRVLLNKPYGSRHYYNGEEYGFSNILEACNFFTTHVARSDR